MMIRRITALILALSGGSTYGNAAQYSVSGDLEVQTLGRGGSDDVIRSVSAMFKVAVDGCRWKINYSSPEEKISGVAGSEIGNNEEGEVFFLTSFNPRPEDDERPDNQFGVVYSGPEELAHSSAIAALLWWAFCSSCYISTNSPEELAPIVIPEVQFSHLYFKEVSWKSLLEKLPGEPGLPERADFLSDGTQRYWEEHSTLMMMHHNYLEKPYPGKWSNGFTNSVYTVDELINTNGLVLPQRFSYERAGLIPKLLRTPKLQVIERFTGTVTNVTVGGRLPQAVPQPRMSLAISDRRFASDENPIYNVSFTAAPRRWLSREEVLESEEFLTAVQNQQIKMQVFEKTLRSRRDRKQSSNLGILGFIGITIFFGVLIWRLRRIKKER